MELPRDMIQEILDRVSYREYYNMLETSKKLNKFRINKQQTNAKYLTLVDRDRSRYYIDKYGMRQGLFQQFYESGEIEEQVNYIDDKRQGLYQHFYESGKIWEHVNYVDGRRQGLYQQFYESGEI